MVKGNRDQLSSESINEVIATKRHEKQKFDNYEEYKLLKINGREYYYGCFSELFTSTSEELVTSYDVVSSAKKPNDMSYFEHFINICGYHGMDKDAL